MESDKRHPGQVVWAKGKGGLPKNREPKVAMSLLLHDDNDDGDDAAQNGYHPGGEGERICVLWSRVSAAQCKLITEKNDC